jgi:tRNA modification GTPase
VVLAGRPNAGKSTLFNALVGRTQALVSPVAGTTRDYLTATVCWDGQTLELIDTAGYDEPTTAIEGAAQQFGLEQRQRGDLAIWCTPADLTPVERQWDDAAFAAAERVARQILRIGTKADTAAHQPDCTKSSGAMSLHVSAASSQGLEELRRAILQSLSTQRSGARQWLGATAARCEESLRAAEVAVRCAEELCHERDPGMAIPGLPGGDELIAVELRDALEHLGAIVGAVYTNDLLDRIFSRFCIGK